MTTEKDVNDVIAIDSLLDELEQVAASFERRTGAALGFAKRGQEGLAADLRDLANSDARRMGEIRRELFGIYAVTRKGESASRG